MSKIHYIWVEDRDVVVVVNNPPPSISDPAHFIRTVRRGYHVLSEGPLGATLVESKTPVQTYADYAGNEEELRAVHQNFINFER